MLYGIAAIKMNCRLVKQAHFFIEKKRNLTILHKTVV